MNRKKKKIQSSITFKDIFKPRIKLKTVSIRFPGVIIVFEKRSIYAKNETDEIEFFIDENIQIAT